MKRVFYFLLILLVAAADAAAQARSARSRTYEVFDAVLDSLYRSHGDKPDEVIVADSLFWREGGIVYGGKFFLPRRSVIRLSTIESFEKATAKAVPFPVDYRYKGAFHVLSSQEFTKLQDRGNEIAKTVPPRQLRDMPYWLAFTEKFPKAWGVTVLSEVGFNGDSTEALIYVRHQCGGGCYSSEVILLDRLSSGWRFVERINFQSNEGLGSGSLRYLGPGAHFIAVIRRQQDSVRRAYADSIRRDQLPRRIRGTVISHQTRLPIPFAQIFVRSHSEFGGDSVRRVVADARGRYTIKNPALGATMLELQCPGPNHRPGATLDAPGLYVFPMTDTVITLGPPNIEPCWSVMRSRTLSSGELSSPAYRESPFPTERDSEVYRAVIRELALADSVIFAADTRPRCERHRYCEALHVAHLQEMEILDPLTFRNFTAVASESVPLNPATMKRLGLTVISKGERSYLEQESRRAAMFGYDSDERGFWTALRANHPGVARIVSFTRPGFNEGRDQALVSVRMEKAGDEDVETVLVARTNDEWRIARRHLEDEPAEPRR